MQFRIFNKSFLLKAFLKYFYICSVEHSCVKVQCRWRTWLPTAVPAPGCVQEKLSAFGAAACCFPFRDEASGGAGNAGRVSLYHGIFSDPDHSDFIHYLEVSAVVHNVWEKSLNILWEASSAQGWCHQHSLPSALKKMKPGRPAAPLWGGQTR